MILHQKQLNREQHGNQPNGSKPKKRAHNFTKDTSFDIVHQKIIMHSSNWLPSFIYAANIHYILALPKAPHEASQTDVHIFPLSSFIFRKGSDYPDSIFPLHSLRSSPHLTFVFKSVTSERKGHGF